jgi:hypothetical protein
LTASLSSIGLFFGMLIFAEAGRRIGIARLARDADWDLGPILRSTTLATIVHKTSTLGAAA